MKKRLSLVLIPLLVISALCAAILVGCRFSAEMGDRDVLAVMSDADVALLAEASGISAETWRALLPPAEGYVTEPDAHCGLPLALIENPDRTGILPLESFDPETYGGPMVKALYLYAPEYSGRATLEDAQAVEDLLFRAVTDRGLRLLILTPLQDAQGRYVTDPAVYREMLEVLALRLESRGYTFGRRFSAMDYRTPMDADLLRLSAGLLPLFLGCWLVLQLAPVPERWRCRLYPAALLLYVLAAKLLSARFFPLLTLATAVVFSCCAGWFVAQLIKNDSKKPLWQTVLIVTAALTGWSLLGGAWVSALMSTRTYLLDCAIFAGVKISLLAPMAFGGLLLLWNLRKPLLQTGLKGWLRLAAVGGLVAAALLVLAVRSGDAAISSLETAFRNWLEYTLYVRPRTKELLFAVPCIPVFLWACRRNCAPLQLLCGAGACLECVSVINTFCHAVAPLQVSVMRTLLGVGLGLIPGLAALLALEGLHRLRTR